MSSALLAALSAVAFAAPAPAPGPAVAPAVAPGPALVGPVAGLPGFEVEFEILNYNYFDLNKALEVTVTKSVAEPLPRNKLARSQASTAEEPGFWTTASIKQGVSRTTGQVEKFPDHMKMKRDGLYPVDLTDPNARAADQRAEAGEENVAQESVQDSNGLDGSIKSTGAQIKEAWGALLAEGSSHRLAGAVSRCYSAEGIYAESCVVDVLRETIREAFADLIHTSLGTDEERAELQEWLAAQKPALLAVKRHGFLAKAPAYKADVYVQFFPGTARPVVDSGETGRSTVVKVFVQGQPETGVDELELIGAVLRRYASTTSRHALGGLLALLLERRLVESTGVSPLLAAMQPLQLDAVPQWSVETCEAHVRTLIAHFSVSYTRRMVPTAIYNECTNYVFEAAFSHDRVFDSSDRMRCRHATVKLAKAWNFGKGQDNKTSGGAAAAAPAPAPMAPGAQAPAGPAQAAGSAIDYRGFCLDVCEIKYGLDAPMCHVTEGKKLLTAEP